MSIFGDIMGKIFHAAGAVVESAGVSPASPPPSSSQSAAPAQSSAAAPPPPTPPGTSSAAAPAQSVDVGIVLQDMASAKGGGGNWQTSIVDLLKLLDLDSSLSARKQLAAELNVHVGTDGTAEENVALHKAVMQKLAENGGRVPEGLKG